jgi:hypothetical protein
MRDAPWTTWQLVTTTPLDRTMKPVPIPSPCSGAPVEDAWYTFVVTLTTDGSTLAATAAYGSDPASRGGTGEIGLAGVAAPWAGAFVHAANRRAAPAIRGRNGLALVAGFTRGVRSRSWQGSARFGRRST